MIEGRGGTGGGFHYSDGGIYMERSRIFTGGAGSVTLRGDAYTLNICEPSAYTIHPLTVILALDPKSKVAGRPDPKLTYSLIDETSFVEGESLFGSLSRTPGEAPGVYVISAGGLSLDPRNSNYRTFVDKGVFTITSSPASSSPEIRSTINSVYVVPPVVSRPAPAQLNVGLQLVTVAPSAANRSSRNAAPAVLSVDPVAAAKRAPGTVLVLTGGVKRAADDKEGTASKKEGSKR